MFKKFIFGPGVETIEDDSFLAGCDEVLSFGDGLAADPIVAFGFANFFAEFALGFWSDLNAAFLHFFVKEAAEVDFGETAFGEVIDDDGFTSAGHADDGEKFDVARSVTHGFYYSIGGWFRGDSDRWRIYAVEGVIWYNEGNETFGDY